MTSSATGLNRTCTAVLVDAADWRRRLERAAVDPRRAPLLVACCVVDELGVSGAGVSVVAASGMRAIVCATDERAQQIEDLQFTLGVGPCIDAVTHGSAVLVADVQEPNDLDLTRWPGFLESLEQAGVKALFSVPLRIGAIRVGALDMHRTAPGWMSPDELRHAFVAADFIASALLDVNVPEATAGELPWPGLSSGMHVHQATGMVQAQLGVDITAALLALRARAFTDGRALGDVAQDVVDRRLRFSQEDDG